MESPDEQDSPGGMEFYLAHPGRDVDVAHYLRQTAITRRRHVPWVNRIWSQNQSQRLPTKVLSWKP